MYLTAEDNMRRPWRRCMLVVMLLLATNYMVQGQDETIACNATNARNSSHTTQNSSCCFNSTGSPNCPDGFYKLNKTSKIPCSYESNMKFETTTDTPTAEYDITICMQSCPQGRISSQDNWCVEIHCDDKNCLTCSGSPSTCTSCRENAELKDGKCELKFPLALVIGCSVGGVVAMLVIIIIIVVFCVKWRKRKETIVESESHPVSNVVNLCDEVEGTVQNTSLEEDDIYVNGPQKFKNLTSGIQQGHDKIFRYVPDPTSRILTNTEKLAQMKEDRPEDLELQSLPQAPVPRIDATKKVVTSKSQRSELQETVETPGRDRADSGELYVNVGSACAALEDDDFPGVYVNPEVDDVEYVNAETFSRKKNRKVTTDASSAGNDSDDDYINGDVVNTFKRQKDDIYVNVNLLQTSN